MRFILFVWAIFLSATFWAQDGSPDLSFGDNGKVLTDLGQGEEYFYAFSENSMGHILVLGTFYPLNGESQKFILSYLEDGSPNSDFGDNGMLISEIIEANYTDIKIQSEDKMLIKLSGYNTPTTVTRYLFDGSIDLSFGNNGSIELFDSNYSNKLQQTDNEHIITATIGLISGEYQVWAKRFLPDGMPDLSFGTNGEMLFPIAESSPVTMLDFVLLDNEGFYILYKISQNDISSFKLLKFLANGNLDQNYGENGVSQVPIEDYYNWCRCLSFEDESALVSCNYFDFDFNEFKKMIKLTPGGALDEAFGNGFVEGLLGAIIQANQRVIVDNSFSDWEGGTNPYYRRLYSDGNLDTSFQLDSNAGTYGSYNLQTLSGGDLLLVGSSIWYSPEKYILLEKFTNSPLGIEESEIKALSISPNPFKDNFTINSAIVLQKEPYVIFDISGKILQKGTLSGSHFNIPLSGVQKGMYFLNITNSTYKLIKN